MKTKTRTRTETFDLTVDGTPLHVKATSFQTYTMETQFRVSVNGSPVYIFGWHPGMKKVAAIQKGSGTGTIPQKVEEAIGQRLYSQMAA